MGIDKLGALLLFVCLAAVISCGGATTVQETSAAATHSVPTVEPAQVTPLALTPGLAAQVVSIQAGDYKYSPKTITLEPGLVRILFSNEGVAKHTFNVKNLDYRGDLFNSPTLDPGESLVLEFTVTQPGSYVFFCILYGHQNKGQDGLLQVVRR